MCRRNKAKKVFVTKCTKIFRVVQKMKIELSCFPFPDFAHARRKHTNVVIIQVLQTFVKACSSVGIFKFILVTSNAKRQHASLFWLITKAS